MNLVTVPIDKITRLDPAPATKARQQSLAELGQVEPVRLASINGSGRFEVMDGRRRLEDMIANGATEVLALVDKDPTPAERALTGLALNLGRSDNPMNEARMIGDLLAAGWKVGEIAKAVGAKQPVISQRIALLKLIAGLQVALESGEMPFTAARYACKWPDELQAEFLAAGDLTAQAARAWHAEWQSDGMAALDLAELALGGPAVAPGLFLDSETASRLVAGEAVTVTWQGQTLVLAAGQPVAGTLVCNCNEALAAGADSWQCPVHGAQ